jgi:hypothetical protein
MVTNVLEALNDEPTCIYDASWANSNWPLFRPLHQKDTSRIQFVEIN